MATTDELRAARSRDAVRDLEACSRWAVSHGWYLLLERHIDERFSFDTTSLPTGVVDGRQADALGAALDDPAALLITSGGPFWGTPITHDPRWRAWTAGRPYGALGVSLLSGAYFGLHVIGTRTRFLGGTEEHDQSVEISLTLSSGATGSVVRTNLGFRVEVGGRRVGCRDVREALRRLDDQVVAADSHVYDGAALARLLDATGAAFTHGPVIVNGREWHRTLVETEPS